MAKIAVCGLGRETSVIGGEGGLDREISAITLASGRGHKDALPTRRGCAAKGAWGCRAQECRA
jgi:hypothetical protein